MTVIGSRYRGTKEFLLVYVRLITTAQYRGVVYYQDIARILGIEQPGHHMAREVGQVLGEVSEDEHRSGRPMLSAVAVATKGYPGDGFFKLARTLGKYTGQTGDDGRSFWRQEVNRVYAEWARKCAR